MLNNLVEGYVFNPTEEQLIKYYLKPWLCGSSLPYDGVVERQVYGDNKEPWNIFPDNDPIWNDFFDEEDNKKKKTMFVISKIIPIGKNKVSRTAGCGTWDGKAPTQEVKDSSTGQIIGQKRTFTFKASKGFESEAKGKGRWMMHEVSLVEPLQQEINQDKKNCVICRITRDKYSSSSGVQQEEKLLHQPSLLLSGNYKRKFDEEEHGEGLSTKKVCNREEGGQLGDSFDEHDDMILYEEIKSMLDEKDEEKEVQGQFGDSFATVDNNEVVYNEEEVQLLGDFIIP